MQHGKKITVVNPPENVMQEASRFYCADAPHVSTLEDLAERETRARRVVNPRASEVAPSLARLASASNVKGWAADADDLAREHGFDAPTIVKLPPTTFLAIGKVAGEPRVALIDVRTKDLTWNIR